MNEWRKRRIKYIVNNSVVGRLIMRLYYEFEELIWLMVSVGIFLIFIKMVHLYF